MMERTGLLPTDPPTAWRAASTNTGAGADWSFVATQGTVCLIDVRGRAATGGLAERILAALAASLAFFAA